MQARRGLSAGGRRRGHVGDDVHRVQLRGQVVARRDHPLAGSQRVHRRHDLVGLNDGVGGDTRGDVRLPGGRNVGIGQHVDEQARHVRGLRHEAGPDPPRAADADAHRVARSRSAGKFMTDTDAVE